MSESDNRLKNTPGIGWVIRHPRVSAWVVLAIGMIALLMIEARDIGLLAGQWVALVVACILVAGACVWIISWEDDEPEPETPTAK